MSAEETTIHYTLEQLGIAELIEIFHSDNTELKEEVREVLMDKLEDIEVNDYISSLAKRLNDFVQDNFDLDYETFNLQELMQLGNFGINQDIKEQAREAFNIKISRLGWAKVTRETTTSDE